MGLVEQGVGCYPLAIDKWATFLVLVLPVIFIVLTLKAGLQRVWPGKQLEYLPRHFL